MSKVYNADLQARVRSYVAETGLSQAKVAPIMGTTPSVLSQYLNSIYPGSIETVEGKLVEFFKLQGETAAATEKVQPFKASQGYIPTAVCEDMYKLIRYCQIEKGLVVIHGDAGIGKTKAAGKFELDNPSSTIYLEASPSSGSLRGVLRMLARELRLPEKMRSDDLSYAIREKLRESQKLVIIDEAQHLKYMALEEISRWADPDRRTDKAYVSIVLMGNTEIYSRMAGRQEAMFAQQFSRILMNRYYSTRAITMNDVRLLFPQMEERHMVKEQEFLLGICQSKHGIRGAGFIYNNALNNGDFGYDGLYSMARGMGIRVLN